MNISPCGYLPSRLHWHLMVSWPSTTKLRHFQVCYILGCYAMTSETALPALHSCTCSRTKVQRIVSKWPINSAPLCFLPTSLDLVGTVAFAQSTSVLKFLLITPWMKNISASSQKFWSLLAELFRKSGQKYIINNSVVSKLKLSIQPITPEVVQYHCKTVQIMRTPSGLSRFGPFAFCLSGNFP